MVVCRLFISFMPKPNRQQILRERGLDTLFGLFASRTDVGAVSMTSIDGGMTAFKS